MTPAADPGPPPLAGEWQVLTASERGASHVVSGRPNQDALAAESLGASGVAVAVADGHGDLRHYRSARGSQLAVTVACRTVAEHISWLAGLTGTGQAEEGILGMLVPVIAAGWRDAVRADAAADPPAPGEQAARREGDSILIGYGTTLLLAVAWQRWLLLAQIGDGDIVGVGNAGQALLPIPPDPLLDGHRTTSLCSAGAERLFRAAALDWADSGVLGVLLATDGYGNAQAVDDWEPALTADLAGLITSRPADWLAEQVPQWVRSCASAAGSADDTSLALMLAPGLRDAGDG